MKMFAVSSDLPIFPMVKEDSTGNYILEMQANQVSDGYHTMDELYDHRRALNIALFNSLNELYGRAGMHMFVPKVFKSSNHHPTSDDMFPGYFIVFAVGMDGFWTSYHYELKYWDNFKIRETEHSPAYPDLHVDAVRFFENLHWKIE